MGLQYVEAVVLVHRQTDRRDDIRIRCRERYFQALVEHSRDVDAIAAA